MRNAEPESPTIPKRSSRSHFLSKSIILRHHKLNSTRCQFLQKASFCNIVSGIMFVSSSIRQTTETIIIHFWHCENNIKTQYKDPLAHFFCESNERNLKRSADMPTMFKLVMIFSENVFATYNLSGCSSMNCCRNRAKKKEI